MKNKKCYNLTYYTVYLSMFKHFDSYNQMLGFALWTLAAVAQQDRVLMLLERKLEAVYKFKPHVKAGDKKVAAMAILGLIITKQMVECMKID